MKKPTWQSIAPPSIAVVLALGAGVYPAHSARSDVDDRRAEAETSIAALETQVAILTPIAQVAEGIEHELLALEALVPGAFDLPGFVVELDTIADRIGVELRSVVPSPVDAGAPRDAGTPNNWIPMELSVRIIGTYVDIVAFAEAITETERLSVIDAINVTASGDASLVTDIRLRLFSNEQSPAPLIARYVAIESEETSP